MTLLRRALLVLAAGGLLCLGWSAQAASVAGVQSGTAVSNGNGALTVTLADPVDPAASVLFFSTRHSSTRPGDSTVRGRLADATTIEFNRATTTAATIDIHWSVVEFASGVRVQHGQVAQSSNTLDVPLAQPVASTAQAFLLYSKTPRANETVWDANDPIAGHIRNTTSIRFRTSATVSHVIDYQVVEFTNAADILVQSGEATVTNSATTNVTLPQTVDPGRTFVLAGHVINNGGSDIGARLLQAEVVDGDTLRFSRGLTGNDVDRVVWQAVELRDGSRVLHGSESFGWLGTASTVALPSPVDTARSVAFSGMQSFGGQSMGSSEYSLGNRPGVSSFTLELAADQLDIRRDSNLGGAAVGWFVVEFAAGPAVPVLDVAMNEASWNGVAGEVTDQATGNDGTAFNGATTQVLTPAIPGNPGTCRYGELDGIDDHLAFADAPELDLADELTVAIWVNTRSIPAAGLNSIVSKDTNFEFHLDDAGRIYWWWNDSSGVARSLTSSAALSVDTWHHVAITYTSGSQTIYLDGVAAGSASYTGTLRTNGVELQVGQDQGIPERFWDGKLDELKIYDQALDPSAVQLLMNETRPCAQAVGDWHFDEALWDGIPGEVTDSSGNGHHGTATDTPTDVGVLCRAADLRAPGTSDYLDLDAAAFDGLDDFTIAAWYRGTDPDAMTVLSGARPGQFDELVHYFENPTRFDPRVRGAQGANVTPVPLVNDGDWHFIAWTRSGMNSCLHVDGALSGCRSRQSGTLDIRSVVVGQDQDSMGGGFDANEALEGQLDELLLFDRALSAAELSTIRSNHLAGLNWDGSARVCPAVVASFVVSHDGAGIHCLDEPVQVSAVDATGAVVSVYAGEITLDTGTGRGSWSLVAGSGSLLDAAGDDGVATYVFDPADNGVATFALAYPEGIETLDVDAFQTSDATIRDDDSEGPLVFAPSGFTVTASALPNPPPVAILDPIPTQVAGAAFPMHVTAYGVTPEDPQCGVIENYIGTRNLTFTMSHVNPASGTRLATVDGTAVNGGVAQPVTFNAGQAQVSVAYKDAGSISLAMTDSASFGNVLTGGSNPFVVRPAALVISRIRSSAGVGNPGAVTATGAAFVAAGEAFEVDVEARDADGDLTPNYGLETPPEGVQVTLSAITVPAAGASGSLLNGATFGLSGVPGRFTSLAVAFDEVGVIGLLPGVADGDYLGAGPVPGVSSGPVGRFRPAVFTLASSGVTPACGTFTYMDQPALGLQYRLQALSALGTVTRNYDLALLADPAAVADLGHVAEAADGGVDLGGRLSAVGGVWVAGEVMVNRPNLVFSRLAVPDGPYDPLQLGLVVTDPLDGVPLAGLDMNPSTAGNCIAAGNCSARALGAPTRTLYGRLAVLPTAGPENENLVVPLAAQVFTGAAFEHHAADTCSGYAAAAVSLSTHTGNLAAGETSVIGPLGGATLSGGVADAGNPPLLAAPGFGNDGTVLVTLDVAPWLEFDWLGTGAADPAGTASFGQFRGHDRIIYWGEPR